MGASRPQCSVMKYHLLSIIRFGAPPHTTFGDIIHPESNA